MKLIPLLLAIALAILPSIGFSQVKKLDLRSPDKDSTMVRSPLTYLRGIGDPNAFLYLNAEKVKIYSTGVFAAPIHLEEGRNELLIRYGVKGDTSRRILIINYEKANPPLPTPGFAIENVRLIPQGDIWLQPGDFLQVEMKASPGMQATFSEHQVPMMELDSAQTGVWGIYRGEYKIQPEDQINNEGIIFELTDPEKNKTVNQNSVQRVTILPNEPILVGKTTGKRVGLDYGLGTDRLGGAKMGFLDSAIRLEITGKMQGMYRVRLADQTQVYVNERDIALEKGINFRPTSIAGSWSVTSRGNQDFVSIGLSQRLPYSSQMLDNPSKIVVDIYGAVSNSNWITQRGELSAIKNVWYEQLTKDIFRVHIELKDQQHWGHEITYRGNSLQIRVRAQPEDLSLKHLTIAVDAGHGGNNNGAIGMTGVREKDLNLSMAHKLRDMLEAKGATVVMTREEDSYTNNTQRLEALKTEEPHLLISIHCNAGGNPMVSGASTYYRHQAFRPLSAEIYKEMLALGLEDFGNVGGFNFTLNSPTAYPSVLVEVAFMSNPADEERLLDPDFHDDVAAAIVKGLENHLKIVDQKQKK